MAKTKTPSKRIMRSFTINEISGVDRPAQKGARVVLLKRDEEKKDVFKGMLLTSAKQGHSHLVYDDENEGGETSYNNGHSHPWVRTKSGFKIGEADNHTHTVVSTTKNMKTRKGCYTGDNMTEEEIKALQDKLAKAEADAKRSASIAELTDVEKQHFVSLKGDEADAFLAKNAESRMEAVTKVAGENPVVYTADDGSEFRKNDDSRLVAMAKRADAAEREASKERALAKHARFVKRAEDELAHLPGDVDAKAAMLKALEAVPSEYSEKVGEILKAADTTMSKNFQEAGTTVGNDDASNDDTLNQMAKALQGKNPGMTLEKAYDAVLETPEGAALYQ